MSVFVFDAYGTLFDVAGAARLAARDHAAEGWAEHWEAIAADWRDKQLAYSWLRTAAGKYVDFWQVTQDALDWALARQGLTDPALRAQLLALYRTLPAYPEVPHVLTTLRDRGARTGILSNGSPGMLTDAVSSAGLTDLLDAVISVDALRAFKPDPRVYAQVEQQFGVPPSAVTFVSANGWDAAAAAGFGFRTLWVNRLGAPTDRLWATPDREARDLTALIGET